MVGGHVVGIVDALARGAAGLGEADQQVGVAVAADLLLVHVGEQEILGFGDSGRACAHRCSEIVRERADIVVVVLRPAREVRAAELAARPGDAEGRLVGALALDGVLEGGAEFHVVHQFGHAGAP